MKNELVYSLELYKVIRCFRFLSLVLHLLLIQLSKINPDVTVGAKKLTVLRGGTYNVSSALGSTARLPCTVTNVEHQAVLYNLH